MKANHAPPSSTTARSTATFAEKRILENASTTSSAMANPTVAPRDPVESSPATVAKITSSPATFNLQSRAIKTSGNASAAAASWNDPMMFGSANVTFARTPSPQMGR